MTCLAEALSLLRSTRQEVAPGNTLHFRDAPFPIIPSGLKKIAFHLTHFLDRRRFWRISHRSASEFFPSPTAAKK